jgi:hypothetical protein
MPIKKKPAVATKRGAASKPALAEGALDKAEAKDALARTTKQIQKLQKNVDRNAWEIGHLLSQASELGLAKAAGFASVEAYADATFSFSHSATFQYVRVARAFSQAATTRYGVEKLDRGLLYIAKTPENELPKDLPTLKIRVPTEDGGVVKKPFADVTANELRLGAQHEAKVHGTGKKSKQDVLLEPHAGAVARANRTLDAAVGKSNAALADVSIHARDGLVLVDVRNVPLTDAPAALAAIAKELKKR